VTQAQHPPSTSDPTRDAEAPVPSQRFGILATITIVGLISCLMALDAVTHAQPFVLPILSVALTTIGFTWAAITALRQRGRGVSLQDNMTGPGLVVFFGFAAAMLSDADQIVKHMKFF
jgi:hypothetical protein